MEIIWYVEFLSRFVVDLLSASLLVFGLYYRRHGDPHTAVTAMLLNVFVFSVLTVLGSVQFSLAAGFGLFAILALFTLRSEQLPRIDVAYFFGSISFAVLFAINAIDYGLMAIIIVAILLTVYVVDHPKIYGKRTSVQVKLDLSRDIDLGDEENIKQAVLKQTGLAASGIRLLKVDGITETLDLIVDC